MENEIIFISTTSALTKKITKLLKNKNIDYPVYEAVMNSAYEIARKSI